MGLLNGFTAFLGSPYAPFAMNLLNTWFGSRDYEEYRQHELDRAATTEAEARGARDQIMGDVGATQQELANLNAYYAPNFSQGRWNQWMGGLPSQSRDITAQLISGGDPYSIQNLAGLAPAVGTDYAQTGADILRSLQATTKEGRGATAEIVDYSKGLTEASAQTGQDILGGYGGYLANLSQAGQGILGGYGALQAGVEQRGADILGGLQERQKAGMDLLAGLGQQERQDITNRWNQSQDAAVAQLTASGLGGTTLGANLAANYEQQKQADLARQAERMQQQQFNAYAGLSGDVYNAMAGQQGAWSGAQLAGLGGQELQQQLGGNAALNALAAQQLQQQIASGLGTQHLNALAGARNFNYGSGTDLANWQTGQQGTAANLGMWNVGALSGLNQLTGGYLGQDLGYQTNYATAGLGYGDQAFGQYMGNVGNIGMMGAPWLYNTTNMLNTAVSGPTFYPPQPMSYIPMY